jgi:uncharacterized membrane protein
MAAQWVTTIGLILDIFGAFLVASEVVKQFKGNMHSAFPTIDSLGDPPRKSEEFILWEHIKFKRMKLGLLLLTVGFILQIVGTWLPTWLQSIQKT